MPKVLYDKRDRVAYVTINRPEAKNAIDPEAHELLKEIWADFRDDDGVDLAILTGTGDAFCAGADLKTYIPPRIGLSDDEIAERVAAYEARPPKYTTGVLGKYARHVGSASEGALTT